MYIGKQIQRYNRFLEEREAIKSSWLCLWSQGMCFMSLKVLRFLGLEFVLLWIVLQLNIVVSFDLALLSENGVRFLFSHSDKPC